MNNRERIMKFLQKHNQKPFFASQAMRETKLKRYSYYSAMKGLEKAGRIKFLSKGKGKKPSVIKVLGDEKGLTTRGVYTQPKIVVREGLTATLILSGGTKVILEGCVADIVKMLKQIK